MKSANQVPMRVRLRRRRRLVTPVLYAERYRRGMRRFLVVLLVVMSGILVGACTTATTAPTTTTTAPTNASHTGADQSFDFALQQSAPEVSNADAVQFEGLGRSICGDLGAGNTVQQEVTDLYKAKLATDVAIGVLDGATTAYCPQFQPALQVWANSQPPPP